MAGFSRILLRMMATEFTLISHRSRQLAELVRLHRLFKRPITGIGILLAQARDLVLAPEVAMRHMSSPMPVVEELTFPRQVIG